MILNAKTYKPLPGPECQCGHAFCYHVISCHVHGCACKTYLHLSDRPVGA